MNNATPYKENTTAPHSLWTQKILGLRYSADIRSIFIVLCALFVVYFPQFYHPPTALIIPWIWASSWLCTMVALVNHNHQHCQTFIYTSINHLLNLLMTLCLGYAADDVRVPHNENHHRYHGNEHDWTGVHVAGTGYGWMRLFRYLVKATSVMKREISTQFKAHPQKYATLQRNILRQRLFLYTLAIFLLWHDWVGFLLYMVIPFLLAAKRLMEFNHILHDGCDLNTIETCSYSFIGKVENWLFLNIGYHTVHHLQPKLHWSLLPQLHQEQSHTIPNHYIRPSMTIFYCQYLFSYKG